MSDAFQVSAPVSVCLFSQWVCSETHSLRTAVQKTFPSPWSVSEEQGAEWHRCRAARHAIRTRRNKMLCLRAAGSSSQSILFQWAEVLGLVCEAGREEGQPTPGRTLWINDTEMSSWLHESIVVIILSWWSRSSGSWRVGWSIPGPGSLHVHVSLVKMLNPKQLLVALPSAGELILICIMMEWVPPRPIPHPPTNFHYNPSNQPTNITSSAEVIKGKFHLGVRFLMQLLLSLWFVSGLLHLVNVTLSVHSCCLELLYGTFRNCLPHSVQWTPSASSFNQTPFGHQHNLSHWKHLSCDDAAGFAPCLPLFAAPLIFTVWGTRSDDQTVNVNKHHFPSHPSYNVFWLHICDALFLLLFHISLKHLDIIQYTPPHGFEVNEDSLE